MTTASTQLAPPFDAELKPILDELTKSIPSTLTPEHLDALRGPGFTPLLPQLLEGRPIKHEERTIDGPAGPLLISIFRPLESKPDAPAFFFTHVGGMIFGDRFVGIAPVVDYVVQFGATVVSVEYRLAPENPAPAALDDSYAALLWTAAHADELGFSSELLFTIGGSAGGGVAAGITLMARDHNGPALAGQILMYAMLDEDNDSVSAQQIDGIGVWDRTSNETGWNFLLGDRRHTDQVTAYASPSKAESLAGLPPTYRGRIRRSVPGRRRRIRVEDLGRRRRCRSARLAGWVPPVRTDRPGQPARFRGQGHPRRLGGADGRLRWPLGRGDSESPAVECRGRPLPPRPHFTAAIRKK